MSWSNPSSSAVTSGKRDGLAFLRRQESILQYAAIILLATFMRAWRLFDIPPGLAQDEVLNADIAENILNGQHALFFREGFGHEPLFHYIGAIFQRLLGDNALAIRLPSVLIGVVTVALVIALAQRWFDEQVALWAGLAVAVSWWGVIFGRIGIRAQLEALLLCCTALLWQRRPFFAGIFLALACYTYSPAIVMLAWPFGVALHNWVLRRFDSSRKPSAMQRNGLIVGSVAIVFAAPLYIYLALNPDLLERGGQLSGGVTALFEGNWRPLFDQSWQTLTYFFRNGDPRWTYNVPTVPLFDPVNFLLFLAGISVTIWQRSVRGVVLLTWLGVGILPSMLTPDAPSSIRMIGALPPTFVLLAVGYDWTIRALTSRSSIMWVDQIFGLFGILALVASTAFNGFNVWANAPEVQTQKYQTVFAAIADEIGESDALAVISEDYFEPIDADSIRRELGYDAETRWVQGGMAVVLPNGHSADFYVRDSADLNPLISPYLSLSEKSHGFHFTTYALNGFTTDNFTPLSTTFGDVLRLEGVKVVQTAADQPIVLLTHWTILQTPPDDVRIFTHLLAEDASEPLTQFDGFDGAAETLKPNDQLLQLHLLKRVDLPTDFTILIGLYQLNSLQRLPINANDTTVAVPQEQLQFVMPK